MFFPTLFNIAKSYRGNADEVSSFKAISSAAWNEKEGYNEWEYNIFIEIYFIILWSNGQKNKNSKSSVSSTCRELSSLNISRFRVVSLSWSPVRLFITQCHGVFNRCIYNGKVHIQNGHTGMKKTHHWFPFLMNFQKNNTHLFKILWHSHISL